MLHDRDLDIWSLGPDRIRQFLGVIGRSVIDHDGVGSLDQRARLAFVEWAVGAGDLVASAHQDGSALVRQTAG